MAAVKPRVPNLISDRGRGGVVGQAAAQGGVGTLDGLDAAALPQRLEHLLVHQRKSLRRADRDAARAIGRLRAQVADDH